MTSKLGRVIKELPEAKAAMFAILAVIAVVFPMGVAIGKMGSPMEAIAIERKERASADSMLALSRANSLKEHEDINANIADLTKLVNQLTREMCLWRATQLRQDPVSAGCTK